MDGVNPTLAFVALFLGLSGHPHDTVQNQTDRSLTFGFGFESQSARHLVQREWQVWGASNCPDFADVDAVEDDSPTTDIDLGIADPMRTELGIVAQPRDARGCFGYRRP